MHGLARRVDGAALDGTARADETAPAAAASGQFTWDCLEDGPAVWRVRIGRATSPSTG